MGKKKKKVELTGRKKAFSRIMVINLK